MSISQPFRPCGVTLQHVHIFAYLWTGSLEQRRFMFTLYLIDSQPSKMLSFLAAWKASYYRRTHMESKRS